jgi:hypothetical protein
MSETTIQQPKPEPVVHRRTLSQSGPVELETIVEIAEFTQPLVAAVKFTPGALPPRLVIDGKSSATTGSMESLTIAITHETSLSVLAQAFRFAADSLEQLLKEHPADDWSHLAAKSLDDLQSTFESMQNYGTMAQQMDDGIIVPGIHVRL